MKSVQEKKRISAEIIAIERTALDRWGKGDVWAFTEISADEVTYRRIASTLMKSDIKALF